MAIYHMQAKVVSRGSGRSAVAASAYMSCSRMYNDYNGIQHDYTRKQGLIYQEVMLPPMAPSKWIDREQLWNAVEGNEKTKDSRYVRQNPISEQWNSDKQLCIWRANWADAVNEMLTRNQINATIDHRSFADQGITEQPTIHEGYIAQNMEKKGMIADRCEINRQIRADNKMLRELKAKVAKLAEAVEKSIPIIAETLEAIRNHMIFTQYHLLHNEMQKEVIHNWMNHFHPILNKYNTVKKKLKDKVAERKELKSRKEQLEKDATAFREEKFRPDPEQYTELLDIRIQIPPDFWDKLIKQLEGTFGKYYDYHRRDITADEVDYLNAEDPDVFSHRAWELEYQRKQEIQRNQPARSKKRSCDMEL